jgi:SulP family sulfate permease
MKSSGTATQSSQPQRRNLAADAVAGLTFAVVNVPQAMAHALLATVNPVMGIYTLLAAMPVAAFFTSSVYMNVSTTSALSVAAGDGLAGVPAAMKVEALAVMVLLMGIMQVAAGLFRLGFLVRFVSNAVMTGFLNGVAVLIILGQLGDLTGYDSRFSNRLAQALDLALNLGQMHMATTATGLFTLLLIVLLLRSRLRRFAFIIAIAAATVLVLLLGAVMGAGAARTAADTAAGAAAVLGSSALTSINWETLDFALVQQIGDISAIPRSLPEIALPRIELVFQMLLPAFSVALIGLIQGAGVSQGIPNPDGKYPNVSRDFLGQGVGNVAAAFVGGVPAGGSISGTAVLMGAGAQSRWANVIAGACVALIVLLAGPVVELVPMPALAALLIVAGFQGLRLEQARLIWNTGRMPTVLMAITFVATLFVPLQYAVLLGVALSIVIHVFNQSNKVLVTELVLQPQGYPIEQPGPAVLPSGRLTVLMIYGSLFFAGARSVEERLPDVGQTERAVVALLLRGKPEIGSTFMGVLQRYTAALQARGCHLMLVGVEDSAYVQLAKTGVLHLIGEENVFRAEPQVGAALNGAIARAQVWLEQDPQGN